MGRAAALLAAAHQACPPLASLGLQVLKRGHPPLGDSLASVLSSLLKNSLQEQQDHMAMVGCRCTERARLPCHGFHACKCHCLAKCPVQCCCKDADSPRALRSTHRPGRGALTKPDRPPTPHAPQVENALTNHQKELEVTEPRLIVQLSVDHAAEPGQQVGRAAAAARGAARAAGRQLPLLEGSHALHGTSPQHLDAWLPDHPLAAHPAAAQVDAAHLCCACPPGRLPTRLALPLHGCR
jgi:hypothetical protein